MDDAQKTPRGHPDFNSYVQNLPVFIFRTDRDINPGGAFLTLFLQVKLTLSFPCSQKGFVIDKRLVHPLRVGWKNFSPLS